MTEIPFAAPLLANTIVDWNFTTTPQVGYMNRTIAFERGHTLGGSSSTSKYNLVWSPWEPFLTRSRNIY